VISSGICQISTLWVSSMVTGLASATCWLKTRTNILIFNFLPSLSTAEAKELPMINMPLNPFRMRRSILTLTFVSGPTSTVPSLVSSRHREMNILVWDRKSFIYHTGQTTAQESSERIYLTTLPHVPTKITAASTSRVRIFSSPMLRKTPGNGLVCASFRTLLASKTWLQKWLTALTVVTVSISTRPPMISPSNWPKFKRTSPPLSLAG